MSSIRVQEVWSLIDQEAPKYGIDPMFAKAIVAAENSASGQLSPDGMLSLLATSPKGAFGLGQVMPQTKAGLIKMGAVPADVKENTAAGQVQLMLATLQQQRAQTGGDPILDAAYYNGGTAALDAMKNGRTDLIPNETRGYLDKVGKTYKLAIGGTFTPAAILEQVTNAGNQFKSRMDDIMGLMRGVNSEFRADAKSAEDAAIKAGEQKGVAIRANADNAITRIDSAKEIMRAMGVNAADPSSLLMQNQAQVAASQQEMMQIRPQLEALKSKSFLEDPLGWLQAQIDIIPVAQRYNAAATRFNNGIQANRALNINAQATLQNNPGDNKDSILASAAAEAEVAANEGKVRAMQFRAQTRQAQIAEFGMEMQHLNMQFNHSKALAQLMQERFNLAESDAKDKKATLEIASVNKYRAMLGKTLWTAEQYKSLPAEERGKWLTLSTNNNVSIGNTPGHSMRRLHELESWNTFTETLGTSAISFYASLDQRADEGVAARQVTDKKTKPLELYEQEINKIYEGWRKELKGRDYTKLSKGSPYKMDASIFASSDALKNNSVAQWVNAQPDRGASLEVKDLAMYGLGQIKAGKPLEQVAAELRQFMYEGHNTQAVALRLPITAFDSRNPEIGQVEYPVSSDLFSWKQRFFNPEKTIPGGDRKMQLFNQADWENLLTRGYAHVTATEGTLHAGNALQLPFIAGEKLSGFQAGGNITSTAPEGQPSIYSSPEEWAAYRKKQAQKTGQLPGAQ